MQRIVFIDPEHIMLISSSRFFRYERFDLSLQTVEIPLVIMLVRNGPDEIDHLIFMICLLSAAVRLKISAITRLSSAVLTCGAEQAALPRSR